MDDSIEHPADAHDADLDLGYEDVEEYGDEAEPWDEEPALAAATLTVEAVMLAALAALAVGVYLFWRRRRRA